jgi:Arm domain-containing DNA-binding protein
MAKVLTAKAIEIMKPGPARIEVPDAAMPGLYLVVQPSGAKSWAFRHRVGGKPKKLTLGRHPAIGLAEARAAARAAAQAVALGKDPTTEKRQAREDAPNLTVKAQVREYHRRHLSKLRSGPDALRVLELSAISAWGDRAVASITKGNVVALIDRVHDERGPAAANMALARVRSFMAWLAARDVIPASPAAGVRMPAQLGARDRVLTDDELRLVWQVRRVVRAVRGLRPALDFDRAAARRGCPDERRRAGGRHMDDPGRASEERRAALGTAVARGAGAARRCEADRAGALRLHHQRFGTNIRLQQGEGETGRASSGRAEEGGPRGRAGALDPSRSAPHLRHRLARLGVRVEVTEAVLNHRSGTRAGIVGVYQRHDFAAEKRAALGAWGRHVLGLTTERTRTTLCGSPTRRPDSREVLERGADRVSAINLYLTSAYNLVLPVGTRRCARRNTGEPET